MFVFSPLFLQSRYEGRLFENERSFVSPVRIQAKDADLQGMLLSTSVIVQLLLKTSSLNFPKINIFGLCIYIGTPNAEIHYSILSGNEENWLQVNSRTGQIKVAKPIDFETLPDSTLHGGNVKKLNFTLRANDKGTPPKFSLAMLTLFVHDVNDFQVKLQKTIFSNTFF